MKFDQIGLSPQIFMLIKMCFNTCIVILILNLLSCGLLRNYVIYFDNICYANLLVYILESDLYLKRKVTIILSREQCFSLCSNNIERFFKERLRKICLHMHSCWYYL